MAGMPLLCVAGPASPASMVSPASPVRASGAVGGLTASRVRLGIFFLCAAVLGLLLWTGEPRAAAPTLQSRYDSLLAERDKLSRDARRSMQREGWEKIAQALSELAKDAPMGDLAMNARFEAGRTWQELARRSHADKDYAQAVTAFVALERIYRGKDRAGEALLMAADIQARNLDDRAAALATLDALRSRYPKAPSRAPGDTLRRALTDGTAGTGGTGGRNLPAVPATSPAPPPAPAVKADPAAAAALYAKAAGEWRTLLGDVRGGARRDNWLALEKQFLAALARDPRGETGAKARFQAGRCMEELAARSYLRSDWLAAVAHFEALARDFPKNSLADDGLYRAAVIQARRLDDTAAARRNAEAVLSGYAKGDMAAGTRDLLKFLPSRSAATVPGPGAPAGRASGAAAPARSAAGSAGGSQGASLVEQLGLTVKTIMIDAGHGGRDPGTINNGITEKTTALKMAKLLGAILTKRGFTVLYTRGSDTFISLEDRPVQANDKRADLFISLHINANTDTSVSGIECYFMDLARSSSAAHVAARENAVSVKGISDLQFILADLMLTSKLEESREMASFVQKAAMARIRRAGFESRDNGVRSAPFYVLMGARMPAVLVEIGYCTNPGDARRIKNDKYLERLAEGIADGVAGYKQKIDAFAR